jgi:hypothetical protein
MFQFLSSRDLLSAARVYKWLAVQIPPDAATSVLATLDNGDPLLLEHTYGKGRVLFFTTSADPSWTNLPVTNLFLPWTHQLCQWLAQRAQSKEEYLVGAAVRFPFPDRMDSAAVKVTAPDGVVTQVKSRPTAESNEAVFYATDAPGLYDYVVGNAERSGKFVVNPDPVESDLTRLPQDELKAVFGARPFYPVTTLQEMNRAIDRIREGVALQVLLFFIVLGLAVLESVASNWGARKRAAEPEGAHDEKAMGVAAGRG